jgi:hypothetical protein
MNHTFYVRGNNIVPRYNGPGGRELAVTGNPGTAEPVSVADASAIGGSSLNFDSGSLGNRQAHYHGVGNWPSTKAFSVLMRASWPNLDGNPHGMFICTGPTRATPGAFQVQANATNFTIRMVDDLGLVGFNSTTFAHGGLSANTWYDFFITFTGDNTSNGLEVFLNAVSLGTATSTRSWDDPRKPIYRALSLGITENNTNTRMSVNEFAVFSGIIDPTNVLLESGMGSLNGASRTSLLDIPEYDGSLPPLYSDPGVNNVRAGIEYTFEDELKTGNLVIPVEADVKLGVEYGSNATEFTGEFEGDTEVNSPSENDVRLGVEYDNGLLDFTGNLVLPGVSVVKLGEQYGANGTEFTGELYLPGTIIGDGKWAPKEVQKEIYLLLIHDSEIIDLLGGDSDEDSTSDKVFDFVPDNTNYPYITLQILPWLPRDNATHDGLACEFQINTWYAPKGLNSRRGNRPVQDIQERIDQLLHNTNLCVDGWNSLQLRRSFIDIQTQDDNVTKHGIQRFNLMIGEK